VTALPSNEGAYRLACLASESQRLSEVAIAIARGKAGAADWVVARDVLAADLAHEDRTARAALVYNMAVRVRGNSTLGITAGHPNANSAAANAFVAWFLTPPRPLPLRPLVQANDMSMPVHWLRRAPHAASSSSNMRW
jgi:hypothetical protein